METNGIYECEICGNTVSIIEGKDPEIMCCGQPMVQLTEKGAAEEGKEKHVPVIEDIEGGVKVKVGSVPHPMEEDHYIGLIQLLKGNDVIIGKRLKPGDSPEAEFCCIANTEGLKARIWCNKHGIWKN